jgi:hypothetical protein|tara:strand:+ start:2022 stop:2552 length:531 start_codon:yes stop_codon:yes gene_type:complete
VKNNIYVQDNFFDKEFFKQLKSEVVTLQFNSRYNDIDQSEDELAKHNDQQRNWHHYPLENNARVVQEVIKKCTHYFHLQNIKSIQSTYLLSFPNTPPIPHTDDATEHNCLIYLVGDKLINNGTGFYEKEKENLTLHTHIGFKENRAIFFDSTLYHSPLLFAGNSSPRYAMANWIGV